MWIIHPQKYEYYCRESQRYPSFHYQCPPRIHPSSSRGQSRWWQMLCHNRKRYKMPAQKLSHNVYVQTTSRNLVARLQFWPVLQSPRMGNVSLQLVYQSLGFRPTSHPTWWQGTFGRLTNFPAVCDQKNTKKPFFPLFPPIMANKIDSGSVLFI